MATFNDTLFSLKAVPANTQAELIQRASTDWNPSLGQAKTWMHMMSLAEGYTHEIKTYNTFDQAYDEYNRPRALIQQITITAKGEYGTTRSAKVQMLIHNEDELNEIARAYFVPDMSVRLQWGWSTNVNGEAPPKVLVGEKELDNESIIAMQEKSANYPCYEGFQGRVMSWDINLRPAENVWQATLELIGAANAVSETQPYSAAKGCNCEKEVTGQTAEGNDKKETKEQQVSNLEAFLIELWDDPNFITNIKAKLGGNGEYVAEKIQYPGFSRDETGQEDSDGFLFLSADLDAEETFVTWGTVETLLSRCSAQLWENDNPAGFELDSRGMVMKVPQQGGAKWFSSDPRVCILPGGGLTFEEPTEWTDMVAATLTLGLSALWDEAVPDAYSRPTGNCFVNNNQIELTKIMVSTVHLLKRVREFTQNKTNFMQAVKTLLTDINTACGSVWEFEIIDVSDQQGSQAQAPTKLAILDTNTAGSQELKPFEFLASAGKSFCRDVKLEFKPTDAMKTQALYGANGKNTKDVPSGVGCQSRFAIYTSASARNRGKKSNPDEDAKNTTGVCDGGNKCDPSKEVESPVEKLQKEAVGMNIDAARSYLEEQKREAEKETLNSKGNYCDTPLLPMNFSATVTGIGGFKWGQSVTCSRIPADMRDRVIYQVTTVEHNITPDDWTTTVNTVARAK